MSGYVSHVIKHSFNPFVDFTLTRKHCQELKDLLCDALSIKRAEVQINIDEDPEAPSATIDLMFGGTIVLLNGFIEIQLAIKEQMFGYSMSENMPDYKRLKTMALALGSTEIWHIQDCYTWDALFEYSGMTFERWFAYVKELVGYNIEEFDSWQGSFGDKPVIVHQSLT